MNRLIFFVVAFSLAKASSWGHMGSIMGSHTYGHGMMPNSERSYEHDMHRQGMRWPFSVMSGLGVPVTGRTGSYGVTGNGLPSSICKGQMMGPNMNKMSHNMIESKQMEKMGQLLNNLKPLILQVGSGVSNIEHMSNKARQMTEQIMEHVQQVGQLHMQLAIQELRQLGSSMVVESGSSMVLQMAQQQAVSWLEEMMMNLTNGIMVSEHNHVTKQLQKTIEVAIMSQMAMSSMQKSESVHITMTTGEQVISNFVNHLQRMIIQYNEMQTQMVMMVYQNKLQQIQAQLQFVNAQVEKIKVHETMMVLESGHLSGQAPQSLQQVLSEMYQQQHHLLAEEVALQMVITILQEVMLSQQNVMQELVIQMSNPSMYMHSMPIMMSKSTTA